MTDAELIADFIARKGVTRVALGRSIPEGIPNCDWMKGKQWSPKERYKRALGYARANGLPRPAWTDHAEGQLLALRQQGKSYRKIAKIMGKTKASIQARVRYLALGRRLEKPLSKGDKDENGTQSRQVTKRAA